MIVPSPVLNHLEPGFVTGFTDGEGCFGLYIYTNTALKIGWYVLIDFKFTIHLRDKDILSFAGLRSPKGCLLPPFGEAGQRLTACLMQLVVA
jgi:hypothetical protein